MMLFAAVNTTMQLLALRALMLDTTVTDAPGDISAYIVPLADAHFGSRVSLCDQRLRYMSGFSGSAGFAIVTADEALLWTDGRYFTQAEAELDGNWTLMRDGLPLTPNRGDYLNSIFTSALIGVDPFLFSKTEWDDLQSILKIKNNSLFPVLRNLVDIFWTADTINPRPPCPAEPIFLLEDQFTGETTSEKLAEARETMTRDGVAAIVLSELDEVAWLLNMRGRDLASASVFVSYLIILQDRFIFFVNPAKVDATIRATVTAAGGVFLSYEDVTSSLEGIVTTTPSTSKIWLSSKCNYALVNLVPAERQIVKLTPLQLMKAVKNDVEAKGMESALLKDAASITRFLHWLEVQLVDNQLTNITEMSAAAKLFELKSANEHWITTSFETISGFGPNGAIIHYRPTPESDLNLTTEGMFLLDSGGIYRDGTTDITRTLHFGTPTAAEVDAYTRVLKGQIAIVTSKFPSFLPASRLDSFARRALWNVGLDYNHGTGHGIGHALNVHEGPSWIRSYYIPDDAGYRPNMFTSNEPGYYEPGFFGVRLENIIKVVNVTLEHDFNGQGYLGFDDLTFVPYQHKLINTTLLSEKEIDYLNDYQNKVRATVGEVLRVAHPDAFEWMERQLTPFTK